MADSAALAVASRRLPRVRHVQPHAQRLLSFPVKTCSALLPGELPASSLLARLLPFSDAWINGKKSSCSTKGEGFTNSGNVQCPAEAAGKKCMDFVGIVARENTRICRHYYERKH